jgi:hypothetical protein
MTENVENLLLEHMRAIRSDIAEMKRDIHELKIRMSSLDSHLASIYGKECVYD